MSVRVDPFDTTVLAETTALVAPDEDTDIGMPLSQEVSDIVTQRTPESVQLAEFNDGRAPEEYQDDAEAVMTEREIAKVIPPESMPELDTLEPMKRDFVLRNAELLKEGDVPAMLELDSVTREIASISERMEALKRTVVGTADIFQRQYQATESQQDLAQESKELVEKMERGEISKKTFEGLRDEIVEESRRQQKAVEEIKALGYSETAAKHVAQILPSMVGVGWETLKGYGMGVAAKIVGQAALGVATGGSSLVVSALAWAPTVGSMVKGFQAGQKMEAGGIAHELLTWEGKNGERVPNEQIIFWSRWGGAAAGSLEFAGTAATLVGAGAAKVGAKGLQITLKNGIKRMATNPVLRNRLVQFAGGVGFSAISEVLTENAQEITTGWATKMAKNPKGDAVELFFETLEEHKDKFEQLSKETAHGTAWITGLTRLGLGGARRALRGRQRAEVEISEDPLIKVINARESRESFEKQVEAVKKSPMLKENPEKLREFIGEEKKVFIPGTALKEYFDERGEDAVGETRKIFGDTAAVALENSIQNGQDLQLDMADVISEMATNEDAELSNMFYLNAKFDLDAMSEKDAIEESKLIMEAEEEARKKAEVTTPEEKPPALPKTEPEAKPPAVPKTPPAVPVQEETLAPELEFRYIPTQLAPAHQNQILNDLRETMGDVAEETTGEHVTDVAEMIIRQYDSTAGFLGITPNEMWGAFPLSVKTEGREDIWGRMAGFDVVDEKKPTIFLSTIIEDWSEIQGFRPESQAQATALHEMGHFILNILTIAYRKGLLKDQYKKDAERVFDWTKLPLEGYLDEDTRTKPTIEFAQQRTLSHETMAEGIETYFRRGEAPSKELEDVFQRLSLAFVDVFEAETGFPEKRAIRRAGRPEVPNLPDDIKEVFDRLLVLRNAYDLANTIHMPAPTFYESLKLMGFTDKQAEHLVAKREELRTQILAELYESEIKKENRRRTKERKAYTNDRKREFIEEVAPKIKAYRVASNLLTGTTPDGKPLPEGTRLKIGKKALLEMLFSEKDLAYFEGLYAEQGVTPARLAEIYGYENAQVMLQDVASHPPLEEAARQYAESEADRHFGDEMTPESVRELVEDKVNERLRAKLSLWEMELMAQKDFKKTVKLATIKGIERKPRSRAQVRAAREAVGRATLAEIANGRVYESAAKKWAKEAVKMMKKGDLKGFLDAKRKEHYNTIFAVEARKLVKTKKNILNKVKRLTEARFQRRAMKISKEMLDDINQKLAEYRFGKRLAQSDPDYYSHIDNLTGNDLQALDIELGEVLSVARVAIAEMKGKRKAEYQAKVAELVGPDDVAETAKGKVPVEPRKMIAGKSSVKKTIRRLRRYPERFKETLLKPEVVTMLLDQGRQFGKWYKAVYEPIDNARTAYLKEMVGVREQVEKIFKAHYTPKEMAEFQTRTIRMAGEMLTKEEALSVLLNYGNEGNRARLEINGVDESAAMEIFSQLSDKDLDFAEEIWTYLDSFWDRISKLEAKTKGRIPSKVEAVSFEVRGRTLRGGYYPIRYIEEALAMRTPAKGITEYDIMNPDDFYGVIAQTKDGHTKERLKEVDLPLELSLEIPMNHLDTVLYDLHFREPVLQVAAILRSPRIADAVKTAIGEGVHDDLKAWLKSVAKDAATDVRSKPGSNFALVEKTIAKLRRNTSMAMMGFSARVALLQPLGLIVSGERLGTASVGRQFFRSLLNPVGAKRRYSQMVELSPFMKERGSLFERDAYEYIKSRFPTSGIKRVVSPLKFIHEQAYTMIGWADMFTSGVTWQTAFDKAMAGKVDGVSGADMDAAVRYADQSVRLTQGSGGRIDLAVAQAHSEFSKIFTMFYGYFNTVFNRYEFQRRQHRAGRISALELARTVFYLHIVVGILEEAAFGRPDEEEEETPDTLKRYGIAAASGYLGMYPVLRELGGAMKGFDVQGSPLLTMTKTAVELMTKTAPKIIDEEKEFKRADRKRLVNTGGFMLGIPASQLNRGIDGLMLWLENEDMDIMEVLEASAKGPSREQIKEIEL